MKRVYLFSVLVAMVVAGFNINAVAQEVKSDSVEVFSRLGHMPFFPDGGDMALMKYISENLQYPEEAFQNGKQGKVIVRFLISKTGEIGEVKVVRSIDPLLDAEAVRLIKSLPKFIPGTNHLGELVDMWYTLPISFRLSDNPVVDD